jgi:hypothetical protein
MFGSLLSHDPVCSACVGGDLLHNRILNYVHCNVPVVLHHFFFSLQCKQVMATKFSVNTGIGLYPGSVSFSSGSVYPDPQKMILNRKKNVFDLGMQINESLQSCT